MAMMPLSARSFSITRPYFLAFEVANYPIVVHPARNFATLSKFRSQMAFGSESTAASTMQNSSAKTVKKNKVLLDKIFELAGDLRKSARKTRNRWDRKCDFR